MQTIEKTALFLSKKSWIFFTLGLIFVFLANVGLEYKNFLEIKKYKNHKTTATVINQYEKINKRGTKYTVLQLKNSDFSFYTSTYEDLKPIVGRDVALTLIISELTFFDYLGSFYAPSFYISLLPKKESLRQNLINYIENQHSDNLTKNLFSALFFATMPSKDLRDKISNFGISHLIALSGYHLGFLGGIIFFILTPLYIFFQKRYFPYRNRYFDLSFISALILLFYLLITDIPPSLLRAYVMMIIALFFALRWMDVFSFYTLYIAVFLIISIAPSFLLSISFWFSVSGVFYIYLFLHYFKKMHPFLIFVFLNIFVFMAMMPIVHFIFEKFTFFQLTSPILTVLFSIFYPAEITLHIIGYGWLLDDFIIKFLSLEVQEYKVYSPLWFLIFYIIHSIASIFNKKIFFSFIGLTVLFFSYAIYSVI